MAAASLMVSPSFSAIALSASKVELSTARRGCDEYDGGDTYAFWYSRSATKPMRLQKSPKDSDSFLRLLKNAKSGSKKVSKSRSLTFCL